MPRFRPSNKTRCLLYDAGKDILVVVDPKQLIARKCCVDLVTFKKGKPHYKKINDGVCLKWFFLQGSEYNVFRISEEPACYDDGEVANHVVIDDDSVVVRDCLPDQKAWMRTNADGHHFDFVESKDVAAGDHVHNATCAICLEGDEEKPLCLPPCCRGGLLHKRCIARALQVGPKWCPFCRSTDLDSYRKCKPFPAPVVDDRSTLALTRSRRTSGSGAC